MNEYLKMIAKKMHCSRLSMTIFEKRTVFFVVLLFISFFNGIPYGYSQEYRIGKGDVLSVTFWQQPDLNRQVTVNQQGEITLPVVGNISAVGLTASELSRKIVDEISIYNKDITQATITILSFESNSIFVTGHVQLPQKYSFEVIPNLWSILLEAGGPTETASINKVRVIRGEIGRKKNATNITVNLASCLESGDFSSLPPIYPGDTIFVPGILVTDAGEIRQTESQLTGENVYIYGQVGRPGAYPIESKIHLIRALVLAGGPTAMANLKEVRIISQGKHYPTVVTLDLQKYTSSAEIATIMINPGDSIFLPQKAASFLAGPGGRIVGEILRVVIAGALSVIVLNAID